MMAELEKWERDFRKRLRLSGLAPTTMNAYVRMAKSRDLPQVFPAFTPKDVNVILLSCTKSQATAYYKAIKQFVNWKSVDGTLEEQAVAEKISAAYLNGTIPRPKERKVMQPYPTYEQVQLIYELAKKEHDHPFEKHLLSALFWCTGCRRSELVGGKEEGITFEPLQLCQIDFKECIITIRDQKNQKIRPVFMLPETRDMLREFCEKNSIVRPDQYVLIYPYDKYIAWLRKIRPKLGLRKLSPHKFRKGLSVHLQKLGWTADERSLILGNTPETTKKSYSDDQVMDVKEKYRKAMK